MNNEQYQQIIDEAYENYTDTVYSDGITYIDDVEEYDEITLDNGDDWPIVVPFSKEKFIDKCKTDSEFSEKWGLKIEERELSLEERLKIADKFNPLIREDCLTKTHHPDETDELKLVYRHEWLDSLGPNVVPQRKLITITYKDKTVEVYDTSL